MGFINSKDGLYGMNVQSGSFAAVVLSDSVVLPPSTLFVGTAGNIVVANLAGGTVAFKNISGGSFLPIIVTKVLSTGTTASDIVLLN